MKIKFHGPIGTVTGSCYELRSEELDVHFLVDYGQMQGEQDEDDWNHADPPFDAASLKFVLLTHAHLDHCGLIPVLYKNGFTGRVICTRETAELARLNLLDAAKHDAPFDQSDVHRIHWHEPPSEPLLNQGHYVHPDVAVTFRRTAHMLGAVSMKVRWGNQNEQKSITFSGDIGNNTKGHEFQPLMRHRVDPYEPLSKSSYLVMESTYGGRSVPCEDKDFDKRLWNLEQEIRRTVFEKGGTLVIPCFAIGRTQAVLFDLTWLFANTPALREIPVFLDAPLATKVNRVYADGLARSTKNRRKRHEPMWLSDELHRRFGLDPKRIDDRETTAALVATALGVGNPPAVKRGKPWLKNWGRPWTNISRRSTPSAVGGPSIVVTGGGMCDGGPVMNYLSALLEDPKHTILLTGFCHPKTVGGQLLAMADEAVNVRAERTGVLDLGEQCRTIPMANIQADIRKLSGYSGHADHAGLLDWFFGRHQNRAYPAGYTTFLTHGNDHARRALRDGILAKAATLANHRWTADDLSVELPDSNANWYDLERGEWIADVDEIVGRLRFQIRRYPLTTRERIVERLIEYAC